MRLLLSVALAVGLASSAFAIDSSVKTLKVDRGLSADVGVSCIDCHQVDQGSPLASQTCPGVQGTDVYMSVLATPKTCGRCHSQEVEEFNKSGHFRASLQYHDPEGRNFKAMSALMQKHEGQGIEKFKHSADMTGCMQCHGSTIELDAQGRPTKETWPSAGVGTAVCRCRYQLS